MKFNANWKNSNWKQNTTQKNQTPQKTFVEVNLERYTKKAPLNLKNFRARFLIVGNCGSSTKSVVKANGWSDEQAIEALPACLTSWAVEEIETVPRHYVEKVVGEKTPQFDALLEVLEPKMQQYRSKRATRSEFKAVKQMENESLKDYFRRVRYLGDLALSEKSLAEKDQDLRDQFLDGLFDFRLQQKLYEDQKDRNFCEVLYRAQELELIQKNSEERRGPLL